MKSEEVVSFFKSWGLYPSEETDLEGLNPEVAEQGINARCYSKLIMEANTKHGANFAQFCSLIIDATDDSFYLTADTWAELEKAWEEES